MYPSVFHVAISMLYMKKNIIIIISTMMQTEKQQRLTHESSFEDEEGEHKKNTKLENLKLEK